MVRPWQQVHQLISPYTGRLFIAGIAIIVSAILGIIFPRVIGTLVDSAFNSGAGTAAIDQVALMLLVIFAVENALAVVYLYLLSSAGENIVARLREQLFTHIMMMPATFFSKNQTGAISSRLTSDITVLQTVLTSQLSQFLRQIIILVGSIGFLFVISTQLALIVLAFLPMIAGFTWYFGHRLQNASIEFQDRIAATNATAEESLAAVRVIQWFTAEHTLVGRYTRLIQRTLSVALRRARIYAVFVPLVTMLFLTGIVTVLWLGGRIVQNSIISGGDLVAFLLYGFTIAEAIVVFSTLFSEMQRAIGASRRALELLAQQSDLPEPAHPRIIGHPQGRLTFDDVSFAYSAYEPATLHHIDLSIEPGETIALVGKSGAGKSTLINLISRFYDPTDGFHHVRQHRPAQPEAA